MDKGFYLIETLLVTALSSILLFGIFSNYLLMKNLYLKQQAIVMEHQNIRITKLLINKMMSQKTKVMRLRELKNDKLEIQTPEHIYLLFIRPAARKNTQSLYLKVDELNAKELVPNISLMEVDVTDEKVLIRLKFKTQEIVMEFKCEKKGIS